jgi:hypothetical protein
MTVAFVTFVVTVLICKKWWLHRRQPILNDKYKISLPDMMLMAIIFLEFLQYISIGPEVSALSSLVQTISRKSSVNLDEFNNLEGGVYWVVLSLIYTCCSLWIVFCIILIKKWDFLCENSSCTWVL